nr:retrovirus-related Pol polyprotein LINE-1 [Tanacetum cinerariifolium]
VDSLDKVMRECPTSQRLILGGDLNGHIGATTEGYAGVHGGFGYGARNEEGRAILDFATAHDLGDLKACKDCRVFPRESCSSQHNLLALDILFKRVQCRRKGSALPRILWKNLMGTQQRRSDIELQRVFLLRFRELLSCQEGNKEERLGALERITKAREGRRRDLWDICFLKDEEGRTITDEAKIKKRWAKYFSSLFNAKEPEGHEEGVGPNREPHTECYYSRISQAEVRTALQKMGRNKAVGPEQIPIEAWKILGDEGTFLITSLFNKIFTSAKIPEEWRLSEVIPIFKNKGDAQVCSNYRVEATHLIRSLMEKYRERQRDLHMAFLDLEKAYDIVPKELIWKTLVDKGTSMRYITVIRVMYDGAKTRVRTSIRSTEFSPVDVGLHQGSISHNEEVDIRIGDKILQPKESFRVEVAELRMLRWTYGKTLLDMIPNGVYRAQLKVESIINKMRKVPLKWFGHVRRRPQSAPVRRVEALVVDGLRRKGRPKLRWEDKVKHDMKELLLSEDMTFDRNERGRTRLGG